MSFRFFRLLALLPVALLCRGQYNASIAAGSGPSSLPANLLRLPNQKAVSVDVAGNLIAATTRNIFRIDRSTGLITLLVGSNAGFQTGAEPFEDNVNALSVHFEGITALAVDGLNNIYFVDIYRRRIFRYGAASGQLQHWAWNGTATAFNGDNIDARTAGMSPRAIAVDEFGTLYIAEAARVRRVDPSRIITTVAGNGAQGDTNDDRAATSPLNDVVGVAVDGRNAVYFAERRGGKPGRVRRLSGNTMFTVAGRPENTSQLTRGTTRPATEVAVLPVALGTDRKGTLFIFETSQIIRVEVDYGLASYVTATSGPSDFRSLASDVRIADTDSTLYFTSFNAIQKFSQGAVSAIFGTGSVTPDNRPARGAVIENAKQLYVAPDGTLFIADAARGLVRAVRRSDGIATNFYGGTFVGPGCPPSPAGGPVCITPGPMALDANNKLLVIRVADVTNPTAKLVRITGNSTFEPVAGAGGASGLVNVPALNIALADPQGLAVDSLGRILVSDRGRCVIWRITGPTANAIAGTGACSPGTENLPAVDSTLEAPTAVVTDRNGNVFFIEQTRHRIRRIDPNGILTTVAGTGAPGFNGESGAALATQLSDPAGLGVDDGGNLYISDRANRRIRRVSGGIMTTIAGNGTAGLVPATDVSNGLFYVRRSPAIGPIFCSPEGLAVASDMTVYVADSCNNQILALNGRIAVISNPPGMTMTFDNTRFTTPAVFSPDLGTNHTVAASDTQVGPIPGTRWKFSDWGIRGTQPAITVASVVEPQAVAANYGKQARVSAAVAPDGAGTVEASPSSPDGYYADGTAVTLTAVPASGYSFDQFSFVPAASPASVTASAPVFALAGFVSNSTGYQPLRINVGGPRVIDSQSRTWIADPVVSVAGSQNVVSTASPIAVPAGSDYPTDVYRTMRTADGPLGYTLRVPNGQYTVRLKFAEIENLAIGQRIFEVRLQGSTVLQGFDIRRAAGAAFRALDLVFPVQVAAGELAVSLVPVAGKPCLSALQIEPYAVAVSVSPAYIEVSSGAQQQFIPLVAGADDPRVVWTVDPALGVIDENGLYTAPDLVAQNQLVSVIATSVADPTRAARADILLTPGWQGVDVGTPLAEGSHSFDSGTFQIRGSGKMGGVSDSFRYVYRALEGDGSVIARVTPDTRSGSSAGIMIRESLDANARHATLLLDRDLNLRYTYRTEAGAGNVTLAGGAGAAWLRLARKGGWLSAFYSLDGQRWVPIGSWTDFSLPATPYVGMVVSSDLEPATAAFDSVRLGGAVAVSIVQGSATLGVGQTAKFSAEATGAGDNSVTWTVYPQVGSIDADGTYRAPADLTGVESVTVTANSVEDPAAYASQVVNLGSMRPLLIRAGGTGFTATDGTVWQTDSNFLGGRSDPVRTTLARSQVYATGRAGTEMYFYQFFVPNGEYAVILRFAEFDTKIPTGSRIFNVQINGATVLPNFDIMAAAGATGAPGDQIVPVTVADGQVLISFEPIKGKSLIDGIEIRPQ